MRFNLFARIAHGSQADKAAIACGYSNYDGYAEVIRALRLKGYPDIADTLAAQFKRKFRRVMATGEA